MAEILPIRDSGCIAVKKGNQFSASIKVTHVTCFRNVTQVNSFKIFHPHILPTMHDFAQFPNRYNASNQIRIPWKVSYIILHPGSEIKRERTEESRWNLRIIVSSGFFFLETLRSWRWRRKYNKHSKLLVKTAH